MVAVGEKAETVRRAVASARVRTTRETVEPSPRDAGQGGRAGGGARGGDPRREADAGAGAAVPSGADDERRGGARARRGEGEVRVRATVEAVDRTGVEMEAMVAASVASLTVYDMIKSADRWGPSTACAWKRRAAARAAT